MEKQTKAADNQQLTVENLVQSFSALGATRAEILNKVLNAGVDFSEVVVPPDVAGAIALEFFQSLSAKSEEVAPAKPSAAISLSPRTEEMESEAKQEPKAPKERKKSKSPEMSLLQSAGLPHQLKKVAIRPKNTNAGIVRDLADTTRSFLEALDPKNTSTERILREIEAQSQIGQIYADAICKLFDEPGSRRYKNRMSKMPEVSKAVWQMITGNDPAAAAETSDRNGVAESSEPLAAAAA